MRRLTISPVAVGLLFLSGCGGNLGFGIQLPSEYPLASYTRQQLISAQEKPTPVELPGEIREQIAQMLLDEFGTPEEPGMGKRYSTDDEYNRVVAGSHLYQKHCIHCHGMAGGGDGPTAPFLYPRPRDYRRGIFKWKSTSPNAKPTRADLLTTIRDGAMGTSMPPFRLLPSEELEQITDYVIFLSKRGETERRLMLSYVLEEELPDADGVAEIIEGISSEWNGASEQVTEPGASMPAYAYDSQEYEQSLARGKALYLSEKAACYKCHGPDGMADPNKIAESEKSKMFDDWMFPNYPRNLTLGMFRGGRRPIDVYRRIHNGIKGAAMPEGGKTLKPEEIWDLVNFARALPYRPGLLPQPKPTPHGHAEAGKAAGAGHAN